MPQDIAARAPISCDRPAGDERHSLAPQHIGGEDTALEAV
jgi:hypothetical protein